MSLFRPTCQGKVLVTYISKPKNMTCGSTLERCKKCGAVGCGYRPDECSNGLKKDRARCKICGGVNCFENVK